MKEELVLALGGRESITQRFLSSKTLKLRLLVGFKFQGIQRFKKKLFAMLIITRIPKVFRIWEFSKISILKIGILEMGCRLRKREALSLCALEASYARTPGQAARKCI